jgi:hypothetical protein
MLGYDNSKRELLMSLTPEEWNELVILKNAINYHPASVHYEKMERFSELMVRSLEGKGDTMRNFKNHA